MGRVSESAHRGTTGRVGMRHAGSYRPGVVAVASMVVALLTWPMAGEAQNVTGTARGGQATVSSPLRGTTTRLADTRALGGPSDTLQASGLPGNIPSLLTREGLPPTAI